MPAKLFNIEEYDRVLVVEGYSDLLFFAEVLEAIGKHGQVFIQELEGKSGLSTKLEALINPGLLGSKTHIGFIFDANGDPQGTRENLQNLLTRLAGQNVIDGSWTSGTPKIGLLIVPGESRTGEIETLVWNSWATDVANAQQKKCIEEYVACMRSAGQTAHSPDKGLIGTLLAIRSDDDPRLGPGARDNVFDLTRPELTPLKTFLSGF